MAEDPFRGLVKPLKGKEFEGRYRKVSSRYRTAEVLLILLRNERTYKV
jgi:hypothetical protein